MSELAAEEPIFDETILKPPTYWKGGVIVCLVWWIGAIMAGAGARAAFTAQFTTAYTPDFALIAIGFIHSLWVLVRILFFPVVVAGLYRLARRSAPSRHVGRMFFWTALVLLVGRIVSVMPLDQWMASPPA